MSYSLVSRAMPLVTNLNSLPKSISDVSQNFTVIIQVSVTTVIGMLPIFYQGIEMSKEIETGIINILTFHFVSNQMWLIGSIFYHFIMDLGIVVAVYVVY